jgi:hypothetical protein
MASESSDTDFGAKVFKFWAKIINVVVTLIYILEDRSVKSILKLFTSYIFWNFKIPSWKYY